MPNTTMMMKMNFKFIAISVAILDLALVFYSFIQGDGWLINTQLAFLSSLFVTIASYFSYKRVILKRLDSESFEDRDVVDKLNDEFDLYDEVDENLDLKEIIKEERKKIVGFKQSSDNLFKSASGAFNPTRLLSYLFLFVSFIYLVNNHKLSIMPYLIGLSVVPLGTLLGSLIKYKT